MFVSAGSLKVPSGSCQQGHDSTRPGQHRMTQPGRRQHKSSWAADGAKESEVIDLVDCSGEANPTVLEMSTLSHLSL